MSPARDVASHEHDRNTCDNIPYSRFKEDSVTYEDLIRTLIVLFVLLMVIAAVTRNLRRGKTNTGRLPSAPALRVQVQDPTGGPVQLRVLFPGGVFLVEMR